MSPILLGILGQGVAGGGAGGSYESIATVTVGSGGSSYVEFTSIPSTYKHLQIRYISRGTGVYNSSTGEMQFNGDTGSNYARHYMTGDGSSASAGAGASTTFFYYDAMRMGGTSANIFTAGIVDILDYANTSKYKTVRSLSGDDTNGAGRMGFWSGLWQNTVAINSIKMFPDSDGFAQYSHFALYGIKD